MAYTNYFINKTTLKTKVVISWSGGKDCCLALYLAKLLGFEPVVLLCMVDSRGYSRSNGANLNILEAQSQAMGIPLVSQETSWNFYESNMIEALKGIKKRYPVKACVFGDISIDLHKIFEESVCKKVGLAAKFPLWGESSEKIKNMLISLNIKSKISVVNKKWPIECILAKNYHLLNFRKLKELNVDSCGENGEFHSIVYDAPFFLKPIPIAKNDIYFLNAITLCDFKLC